MLRDGTAFPDRTGDLQSHNLEGNSTFQGLSGEDLENRPARARPTAADVPADLLPAHALEQKILELRRDADHARRRGAELIEAADNCEALAELWQRALLAVRGA